MEIKNKLHPSELLSITLEAHRLVQEGKSYHYRFGQAVFNLLKEHHPLTADEIWGTELDFFYQDDEFTNNVLFNYIVKEEK